MSLSAVRRWPDARCARYYGESGIDARTELVSGAAEPGSVIAEESGEAVVISELEPGVVADARVMILCGSPESSRRALGKAEMRKTPPAFVDVSGALEEEPSPASEPPWWSPPLRRPLRGFR